MCSNKVNYRDVIAETTGGDWNVLDQYKNLTLLELRDVIDNDKLPYAVCVLNLTGDLNVGMIMRTACLMGAERMIIFGRRKYDKRSTVGSQNYITVDRIDGLEDDLTYDIEAFDTAMSLWNYQPICIETGGPTINQFNWKDLTQKPCLVFGNEGRGIPDSILRDLPRVSIPQRGVLRSLNVAVAAGIACWEVSQCLVN